MAPNSNERTRRDSSTNRRLSASSYRYVHNSYDKNSLVANEEQGASLSRDANFYYDESSDDNCDDTSDTLEDGLLSESQSLSVDGKRNSLRLQNASNRASRHSMSRIAEEGRETWLVILLRCLLFAILLIACVLVTFFTYYLFNQQEQQMFKSQFDDFGMKISNDFHHDLQMRLWSAQMMSTIVGSFSFHHGSTYPNITLDDWSPISYGSRMMAHTSAITLSPVILNDAVLEVWEEHISAHHEDKGDLVNHQDHEDEHNGNDHGMGHDAFELEEDTQGLTGEGHMGEGTHNHTSQEHTHGMMGEEHTMDEGTNHHTDQKDTHSMMGDAHVDGGAQNDIVKEDTHGMMGDRHMRQRLHNDGIILRDQEMGHELHNMKNESPGMTAEVHMGQTSHQGVGIGGHHEMEHGIFEIDEDQPSLMVDGWLRGPPYAPIAQLSTSLDYNMAKKSLMYNQMAADDRREAILQALEMGVSFSPILYKEKQYPPHIKPENPYSIMYCAIRNNTNDAIGVVGVEFIWEQLFKEKHIQNDGNLIVLKVMGGPSFSFQYKDGFPKYIGEGDHHPEEFSDMVIRSIDNIQKHDHENDHGRRLKDSHGHDNNLDDFDNYTTHFQISVYPSANFKKLYVTRRPEYFALAVALIFVFTSTVFIVYDRFVERRNWRTKFTAQKTSALVDSLFPASVQARLLKTEESKEPKNMDSSRKKRVLPEPPKLKIKWFLDEADSKMKDEDMAFSPPIADLFPSTTVMFADIAGFTAWSSEREPTQVFQLLETLYRKFDELAKKLGVFKVETIGDCYVAVAGLPEPNDDHALIMCQFAWAIKQIMHEACSKLEATLGPGTSELKLRIGLHSGPVTAGVLRGDKSRFQLFGDTMNTASRMESNSLPDKVQISQATADHLVSKNKNHWMIPRDDLIEAKGKGMLQTFFLQVQSKRLNSTSSLMRSSWASLPDLPSSTSSAKDTEKILTFSNKFQRQNTGIQTALNESLVKWNSDVLETSLKKVVSSRNELLGRQRNKRTRSDGSRNHPNSRMKMPIEELVETLEIPEFSMKSKSERPVYLSKEVREQLHDFVARIASNYRDVPFHNLEHASHVTMSANKLVNRIVLPQNVDYNQMNNNNKKHSRKLAQEVHDSTFGISSDSLAQFAIVFSALIHDVDHTGLTNAQLVKEKTDVAVAYKGQSVAEQNSVTLAWSILMEPQYQQFREAIFANEEEKKRFRELIVSIVLATDIIDRKLQSLRKKRWERAFNDTESLAIGSRDHMNQKATIVLEHIIQASDVAHTMQHWHIFCKWNEKLFNEKYWAYIHGHEDKDPVTYWYEGEIGFFDGYVIPLAKKLKECGVFGVSSQEYLGFALENRKEWEGKGKKHVVQMHARATKKFGLKEDFEFDDESFDLSGDESVTYVSGDEISC